MRNRDVAALLKEMADLLELAGNRGFEPPAYRKAARAVALATDDVALLWREGRLLSISGVGTGIARKIGDIMGTGTFPELEALRARVPAGLLGWLRVPGLGPRTAARIHAGLGISTLAELREAAGSGRLRELPGLGRRREADILAGLRALDEAEHRLRTERALREKPDPGLPGLVQLADLRGDLHTHSRWSDGRDTIRDMALAARGQGYAYLGIADHSPSLAIARGLTPERLRAQAEEIAAVNQAVAGLTVLRCTEVDILTDGRLDLPDETLAELDFVTASIHSAFHLDRAAQTARLAAAIRHPHVDSIGHATGRLLSRRPGYDADWPQLFALAAAHGTAFEVNASPDRLDLGAALIRQALAAGVKLVINSDAHAADELNALPGGVAEARRGGARPGQVLNTLPWAELRQRLKGG